MNPQPFAWIVGAILLLFGVCGFIPPLTPIEPSPLRTSAGVGGPHLFGVFPVSNLLSALHAALGVWGLIGGSRLIFAVLYARVAGFVFIALVVMGFIPGTDDLFGEAPLYGNNLLLHGGLAVLFFLFGWLYRRHPWEVQADRQAHF
jgi:hypothetical protein